MLGTVAMLRRYPVKSMLGEEVPASDVTGRGLAHDRALALVHLQTGKVASAKNPRLWRGLLKLAAAVEAGPGGGGRVAEVERYRPNIVVRTAAPGFTENDWAGHSLRIGGELALRVMSRTPRCAIPTLEHAELPRDTDALRVLAEHNRVIPVEPLAPVPCAGVYAQVLHPGRIRVGDVVRLS